MLDVRGSFGRWLASAVFFCLVTSIHPSPGSVPRAGWRGPAHRIPTCGSVPVGVWRRILGFNFHSGAHGPPSLTPTRIGQAALPLSKCPGRRRASTTEGSVLKRSKRLFLGLRGFEPVFGHAQGSVGPVMECHNRQPLRMLLPVLIRPVTGSRCHGRFHHQSSPLQHKAGVGVAW
jgi:hypothetical protein